MAEFGSRIKDLVGTDGGRVDAVVGKRGSQLMQMPDEPGPAVTGRTPVVGQLRRQRDLPVLRDQIGMMMD